MLPLLILLFTLMPIIEIMVLLQVGEAIGGWNTIAVVIITAVIGASLVRSQGLLTMFRVRQRMAMGEIPGKEMVEGLLLVVAGVLLVTPGFVTDVAGLLLVTPVTRNLLAERLLKRMVVNTVNMGGTPGAGTGHGSPFEPDSTFEQRGPSPFPPKDDNRKPPRSGGGNVYEGEYTSKD